MILKYEEAAKQKLLKQGLLVDKQRTQIQVWSPVVVLLRIYMMVKFLNSNHS